MSGDLDEHVSAGTGKETKPQNWELDPDSISFSLTPKGMRNSELKYHKFGWSFLTSTPRSTAWLHW